MLTVQIAMPSGPLDARACFGFIPHRRAVLPSLVFSAGMLRDRTSFVADRLELHHVLQIYCSIKSYMSCRLVRLLMIAETRKLFFSFLF